MQKLYFSCVVLLECVEAVEPLVQKQPKSWTSQSNKTIPCGFGQNWINASAVLDHLQWDLSGSVVFTSTVLSHSLCDQIWIQGRGGIEIVEVVERRVGFFCAKTFKLHQIARQSAVECRLFIITQVCNGTEVLAQRPISECATKQLGNEGGSLQRWASEKTLVPSFSHIVEVYCVKLLLFCFSSQICWILHIVVPRMSSCLFVAPLKGFLPFLSTLEGCPDVFSSYWCSSSWWWMVHLMLLKFFDIPPLVYTFVQRPVDVL